MICKENNLYLVNGYDLIITYDKSINVKLVNQHGTKKKTYCIITGATKEEVLDKVLYEIDNRTYGIYLYKLLLDKLSIEWNIVI